MSKLYYLIDTSQQPDNLLLFWRPDNCGYTTRLDCAGKYEKETIMANQNYYLNDGLIVVPCEEVEKHVKLCVHESAMRQLEKKKMPRMTPSVNDKREGG